MRSSNDILDKIKLFKNISRDSELARVLCVKPNVVSTWRTRNTIPYKELIEFCSREGLDVSTMLSPEGELEKSRVAAEMEIEWGRLVEPYAPKILASSEPRVEGASEFVSVNVYPLKALSAPNNSALAAALNTLFMPAEMAQAGPVAFMMDSDSMSPIIRRGAYMGVAYRNIDITEGKLYIARSPAGEIFIGAYFRHGDEILLKTANPDFPDITLQNSMRWNFIARVEWVMQGL